MNVAERRIAHDLTAASATRWLAPLMRATESITICDSQGRILFWNESSERLYGWSGDDVLGHSLAGLGCEVQPACWEKALADGCWSGMTRRRRRDGIEIDVYLRSELMSRWGDTQAGVIVEYASPAYEISAAADAAPRHMSMLAGSRLPTHRGYRYSSGNEIKISDTFLQPDCRRVSLPGTDRYQRLFDNVPLAVLQVDASVMVKVFSKLRKDGVGDILSYLRDHPELVDLAMNVVKITAANELATALLRGGAPDQLLGPVGYLFKETPGAALNVMAARFDGRKNHTQQMRVAAFDGSVIDVLFMVSYPHQSEAMEGTTLMMVDITDRLRLESQLKQIEADFERVTRFSALGEMVGSIAHEVRQPLSSIMTDGETSLKWLERDDINLAKLKQINARIVASASQAGGIVDKIKEMAVGQAPVAEELLLNDVILQSVKFIRSECDAKSTSVVSRLDSTLPTISGDVIQLQQVIVNLLMNALYAVESVESGEREIRLRTYREENSAVLVVEDSGPGISNDNLERIFERFFSTRAGGMGMGLAICKSIIDAHGGAITASNARGGGAVLTVRLPVSSG